MNLGTPDAPETGAVRRYLREFLSDPRVIDINAIGRAALLNLVILPRRPSRSAEAYRKVWTDRGSPLLFHSLDLTEKVRARLGTDWHVELAMRYGKPSVESALAEFRAAGVDRIAVFPLFPQYASSSTGSALEKVYREVVGAWNVPSISVIGAFYADPGFIEACAAASRPTVEAANPDFVLMSFHGLPERQIRKSDESGGSHCLQSASCCDAIAHANRNCYRAQCFATARGIASALALADDGWSVSFQSRLGRTPWIRPYTDVVFGELRERGIERLVVLCPAFVADCLETLEEIGIRAAEQWHELGGESLTLAPAVNSSDRWADAVTDIVLDHVGQPARSAPTSAAQTRDA